MNHITPSPSISPSPPHSIVDVDDQGTFSRGTSEAYQVPSRRMYQDIQETRGVTLDHDEDKYKRRPVSEGVRRWWKNVLSSQPQARTGRSIYKRYCMLAIILILSAVVLLLVMSRLGQYSTEDDPIFDPLHHPQVRVQHSE